MGVINDAEEESFGSSGVYTGNGVQAVQKLLVGQTKMVGAISMISTAGTVASPTPQPFAFMHAGDYRLCYAPDGNFGIRSPSSETKSYWLPVSIRVEGISSVCLSKNCLKDERWHCFYPGFGEYGFRGFVSCKISFVTGSKRAGWSMVVGSGQSKMSWSAEFGAETYNAVTGAVTAASARSGETG